MTDEMKEVERLVEFYCLLCWRWWKWECRREVESEIGEGGREVGRGEEEWMEFENESRETGP